MTDKTEMDCECMNEEFGKPHYHWKPVAEYYPDGEKKRDYTPEEQAEWIRQQLKKEKGR